MACDTVRQVRIFTEADCWILPIGMQNRGRVAGHGRANVRLENTRDVHMKPEVSIIVPAFNASELLPKALKSLADHDDTTAAVVDAPPRAASS